MLLTRDDLWTCGNPPRGIGIGDRTVMGEITNINSRHKRKRVLNAKVINQPVISTSH